MLSPTIVAAMVLCVDFGLLSGLYLRGYRPPLTKVWKFGTVVILFALLLSLVCESGGHRGRPWVEFALTLFWLFLSLSFFQRRARIIAVILCILFGAVVIHSAQLLIAADLCVSAPSKWRAFEDARVDIAKHRIAQDLAAIGLSDNIYPSGPLPQAVLDLIAIKEGKDTLEAELTTHVPVARWFTCITGLFELKKMKLCIYYPGGKLLEAANRIELNDCAQGNSI